MEINRGFIVIIIIINSAVKGIEHSLGIANYSPIGYVYMYIFITSQKTINFREYAALNIISTPVTQLLGTKLRAISSSNNIRQTTFVEQHVFVEWLCYRRGIHVRVKLSQGITGLLAQQPCITTLLR